MAQSFRPSPLLFGLLLFGLARLALAQPPAPPLTGVAVAWGANHNNQTTVPAGLSQVTALAARGDYTLALRLDGAVLEWGDVSAVDVPSGLGEVKAIAAGYLHALALKPDGHVVAWGNNSSQQTDVPPDLTGVIAVAAGGYHSLALKSDGTVVAWGDASQAAPADLSGVIAISAGLIHSAALKADGTVTAWGDNTYGQTAVPNDLQGVTAIAAGRLHTVALKQDGTVVAWGHNNEGQTDVPPGLTNVVAVAAGDYHTLALKEDGTVVGWGEDDSGETDVPSALRGVFAIAAGSAHSVALVRAPYFTEQPSSQAVHPGQDVTLTAAAAGEAPLRYQWRKDGVALAGATNNTLTLANVQAKHVGRYVLVVSGQFADVPSATATLSLLGPATIVSQPTDRAFSIGQDASLTVTASGTEPLRYQWQHEGVEVDGATGATLSLGKARFDQAGRYTVRVSNDLGATNSSEALLTVTAPTPGTVVAAGSPSDLIDVPPDLPEVAAIAAGWHHTLALTPDGTVLAWGLNDFRESDVPADLTEVVAIAAGGFHSVALKRDGTLAVWGRNAEGQTDVPPGLTGVTAIAAGRFHTVALRQDGSVVAWGDSGQAQPAVPANLTGVAAIAGGSGLTLALKRDGTVLEWVSDPTLQPVLLPGLTDVIAVSAGAAHVAFLRQDGTVVAMGADSYGQSDVPAGLGGVTAIAAGGYFTAALQADRTITAWGDLSYGQRNVLGVNGVTAMSAGEYHLALLTVAPVITAQPTNQTVNAGENVTFSVRARGPEPLHFQWRRGAIDLADATNADLTLSSVDSSAQGDYSVVITNPFASVTSAVATLTVVPPPVYLAPTLTGPTDQVLRARQNASFSVVASGTAPLSYQWRKDGVDLPGATGAVCVLGQVQAGDAGSYSVVVTNLGGSITSAPVVLTIRPAPPARVVAWGKNDAGQTNVPPDLDAVIALAAGGDHSLALREDGTVTGWGLNSSGQGTIPPGLGEVTAIAAGFQHSLALQANGTVVGWGANDDGQTRVPRNLSEVVALAAGASHSLALEHNGTVVAWGDDTFGQTDAPAGLRGVAALAAGWFHNLVLKRDGTVAAGGFDWYGATEVPAGLSGVIAVAAGGAHNLALLQDGTVVAWGRNDYGQSDVPPGLHDVVAIAAGGYHSVALKRDGTIVAWGWNTEGQTRVPPDLRGVVAIAAGSYHTLALRADPEITTQPLSRTVTAGQDVSLSVVARGAGPLSYEWRRNDVSIGDATEATLRFTNAQPEQAGDYRVIVSNAFGSVTSIVATLSITPDIVITAQPQSRSAVPGATVTFKVGVRGSPLLFCQWLKDGNVIDGATEQDYTFIAQPNRAGDYQVVVSNHSGTVTSAVAHLTIMLPPAIMEQPHPQRVGEGGTARFTVRADGMEPLSYQWRCNDADVTDATRSELLLTNLTAAQSGRYAVVVTNPAGSTWSEEAVLTVVLRARLSLQVVSGSPSLTLTGTPGANYTVQSAPELTSENWTPLVTLTNLPASPYTLLDPNPATNQWRFYRVIGE